MTAERGLRVARGEGWSHGDQDGGEGSLGTVVLVKSDLKIVTVIWDNGIKGCYEIASETCPVIVAHDAKQNGTDHRCSCAACNEPIIGFIWNCLVCVTVDLCTKCYMEGVHDVTHPFRRKSDLQGNWATLPERSRSVKVTTKGFFPGATVEPACSLRNAVLRNTFQSLDENFGRIINYESRIGNSFSAICVVWNQNLRQTVYQIGRDAKVEVRCTIAGYGPKYYKGHLPGLMCPAEGNTRSRGYTTSQIPLHHSLQYSSLQATQSPVKPNVIAHAKTNTSFHMQGRMTSNHRYTKSSTVDTKSFKAAGEICPRASRARIKTITAECTSSLAMSQQKSARGEGSGELRVASFPTIGFGSTGALVSSEERIVTNGSKTGAIRTALKAVECETNRNAIASHEALMIGDNVKVNIAQNLLSNSLSSTPDMSAKKIGRLQYINEEDGFGFVHFTADNSVLKVPTGALIKITDNVPCNFSELCEKSGGKGPKSFDGIKIAFQNSIPNAMRDSGQKGQRKSLPSKLSEEGETIENSGQGHGNPLLLKCKEQEEDKKEIAKFFKNDCKNDCMKARGKRSISGNSDDSGLRADDLLLCCLCQENECAVRFEPCGHLITCSGCSKYFKKCCLCENIVKSWGTVKSISNCMICNENAANIEFLPCKHKVACQDCCLNIKRCIECKVVIVEKIDKGGQKLHMREKRWESLENLMSSVEKLRSKVMTIECKSKCQICCKNNKNCIFQCGHASCEICGENLIVCPVCHVKIEVKTLHAP